jgi:hypothetical protein
MSWPYKLLWVCVCVLQKQSQSCVEALIGIIIGVEKKYDDSISEWGLWQCGECGGIIDKGGPYYRKDRLVQFWKWLHTPIILKRYRRDEGYKIPYGYRIAWYNFSYPRGIFLPMPLCWIARWGRDLWLLTYYYKPNRWDRKFIDREIKIKEEMRDECDRQIDRIEKQARKFKKGNS